MASIENERLLNKNKTTAETNAAEALRDMSYKLKALGHIVETVFCDNEGSPIDIADVKAGISVILRDLGREAYELAWRYPFAKSDL